MTDAGTFALLGYCHASILHLAAEIISQAMCNAGLTSVDAVVPVNCDFCTAKCELAAKASSTGAKQSETPLVQLEQLDQDTTVFTDRQPR